MDAGPGSSPAWLWRLRHALVLVLFGAVALNTDTGRILGDTKIDLVLDPGAFLARALHLWDPLGSGGQLQNQAYGYLFPMGPFFWLGEQVGLSSWVTQRLWWALLLGVSYAGFVLLARRLEIGANWSQLIGGVAFALSPHVLTVLGRSSIEVWPPALAPWILLPLVGRGALDRPLRAAALSGVAIGCTGGVNAAVNLAAVLPAALWLLTRAWSRALVRLIGAWVAAALLATVWWAVPLVALGQYSPPFLNFIESASFTTSTTALVQVLRGTGNWVAYVWGSGSQAGFAMLTTRVLILLTVVVTAAGLAGVGLRRTPHRRFLATLLFVGVLLVTLGHAGAVEGFFAADVRNALDAALAPIRNVHKFDILIRLSLMLGLVSLLHTVAAGRNPAQARFQRTVVAVAGVSAVAGAASSFFGLAAAPARSFEAVPTYWTAATQWLADHQAQGRTLLLPGSRFADYTWGYPADEPIQATDTVAWDVRNAVPLTEPDHVRWLDAVEQRVADGVGGGDLAPALADAGVGYVLIRSDLNFGPQGATRPSVARTVLAASPGLQLVAQFGPETGGAGSSALVFDAGLSASAPAIEIWAVQDPTDSAVLTAAADIPRVIGGAETAAMPPTATSGTVLVGVGRPSAPDQVTGPVVLTDTPRRREVNVGVGAFGTSFTLSYEDPRRLATPTRDYSADDRLGAEATATSDVGITASSSAGDAGAGPRPDRAAQPYAAFDASLVTAWRPDPGDPVVGSWVQADFPRAVDLRGGTILFDPATSIRRVTLSTTQGQTSLDVRDDRAELPAVSTAMIRITVSQVASQGRTSQVGIRTVAIPGLAVARPIMLPAVPEGLGVDRISLNADTGRPGCLLTGDALRCSAGLERTGEEAAGLDRIMTLGASGTYSVAAAARPVTDPALVERVSSALDLPLRATASSAAVSDLAGHAVAAVDGDPTTTWVAGPDDLDPTLTVAWTRPTQVSGFSLSVDPDAAATPPTRVRVVTDGGSQDADVAADGSVAIASVTTTSMEIHLGAETLRRSLDPYLLTEVDLGIGVSEISVDGVAQSGAHRLLDDPTVIDFTCGTGPTLHLGDSAVQTSARATVGALLRSEPLTLTACDAAPITLPAGAVHVQAADPDHWLVSSLQLSGVGAAAMAPRTWPVQAAEWSAAHRVVALPARDVATVLRIRENTNAGWSATLDGKPLVAVTISGWQQGWVVPAGAATEVELVFGPDAPVRTGMMVGALVLLVMLAMALVPRPRPSLDVGRPIAQGSAAVPLAVGGLSIISAAGPVGMAIVVLVGVLWLGLLPTSRLRSMSVGWARDRGPRWAPGRVAEPQAVVAAVAYLLAGLTIVWRPYGMPGYLGNSVVAQVLCVISLGALLSGLLPRSTTDASDVPSAELAVPPSAGSRPRPTR